MLGNGEGQEVELSATSSAMAEAVAMDTRGKTLIERVEPILTWRNFSPTTPNSRQFVATLTENIIPDLPNNHEGSGRGVDAGKGSAGCEGQVAACGELEG